MIKKRYWAFVAYPDSLPNDWLLSIQLKGIAVAISPLHNHDINPTGELKKPHYHIILCFNSPTTYNNVVEFSKEFNGTIPIPLESPLGMYRYLTHKDNPEKYQYSESDIITFNGFDTAELLNSTEVFALMRSIHKLIIDNSIYEYSELMNYLLANPDMLDMYNVAMNHTIYFNTLITSLRNKKKSL